MQIMVLIFEMIELKEIMRQKNDQPFTELLDLVLDFRPKLVAMVGWRQPTTIRWLKQV